MDECRLFIILLDHGHSREINNDMEIFIVKIELELKKSCEGLDIRYRTLDLGQ